MVCIKCKREISEGSAFCNYCGARQTAIPRPRTRRANGFGSVFKLSGRRRLPWTARKDGQYLGFWATKKEALEALERLSGRPVRDAYNFTFTEVFEAWKPEHYPELTERGRSQYDRAYDVFKELHQCKFRELRTADFQRILDQHSSKSKSTVSKYKQLLTQMSRWAMREELITTDFASFCKVSGRASVGHEAMTEDEIKRIFAAAETSETAKIVCMLLATGMRIGELFQLPLADYHGEYVIGGEKTDAGRGRIIPIRREGREFFAYFAQRSEGHTLLLDSYVGNHNLTNFRKRDYYPLLDRLGISRTKTPHSTRVTFTTMAIDGGIQPAALQKVLGHADFSTTQKHYNKPDAGSLVNAVNRASRKKKSKKNNAV